jgi:hypothetical protein
MGDYPPGTMARKVMTAKSDLKLNWNHRRLGIAAIYEIVQRLRMKTALTWGRNARAAECPGFPRQDSR